MKKFHFLMKRLSLLSMAAALPLMGIAQRVSLPYGYAARGGMSYCPNTYLPGWMAVDPNQPVQDATFLIKNPDFSSGADGWNCTPTLTVTEDGHASMSGVFDVFQVLENIPNGIYELSVNGFYEGEKSLRCAWLYVGNNTMALKTAEEGDPDDLLSEANHRTVRTIVINHSLRVGVKGIYNNTYPVSFDDFRLSYVGKYVVDFEATIAENYTGGEAVTVPVGSWEAGQQVAVHAGGNAYKYEALSDGASTKLVAGNNGSRFPRVGLSYTAVRPYNEDDATNNTLTLPQEQTYVENGIDTLANPMAAIINQGDDLSFSFKNVYGLLQFNLTGDNVGVTSINVKANDGKKLYGTGTLSFDADGNPTWSCTDGGDNVTLSHTATIALNNTATPFYIALPPATYSGLTVTVTGGDSDNTCTIELGKTIITRSGVTAINQEVVYKSISVAPASLALGMDKDSYKTKTLTAAVVPESSTVEWSSSNENVATVSSAEGITATVTANAAGTATITATIQGTSISATCTVHVAPVGAIPWLFSVSSTKQVYFSKGNLWYGALDDETEATWNFENEQYGTQPGSEDSWNAGHVSHFYWSSDAGKACAENYYDTGASGDDVFFTNQEGFTVNGQGGWFALSDEEWKYLLEDYRMEKGKSAWKPKTIEDKLGLCLYPDDYSGEGNEERFADLAEAGVVFLPAAGWRYDGNVGDVWLGGNYWSATSAGGDRAQYLGFPDGFAGVYGDSRDYGYSVRLVRLSEN